MIFAFPVFTVICSSGMLSVALTTVWIVFSSGISCSITTSVFEFATSCSVTTAFWGGKK